MKNTLTNGDVVQSLECIWDVVFSWEASLNLDDPDLPQDLREIREANVDDVKTSMAWITEALGLDISTADDDTNGEYIQRK